MARCRQPIVVLLVAALAACAGGGPPGNGNVRDERHAAGAARAEVLGFKSARFGMSEAQIRDAIVQDFHVASEAIRAEDNSEEKTQILLATVPDVLPGGGIAEIAYAFGFESHRLVQIGITWSASTDPALTPERLIKNARLLAEHFKEAGYRPESIATDVPLSDGMLVFRGTDKAGHATLLALHGPPAAAGGTKKSPPPAALTLYYIADPEKPDVDAEPRSENKPLEK